MTETAWTGHARGSKEFTRLLVAMFCAGVATFAQLYAPQAILPSISAAFDVGASSAALMVSAGTLGLALCALPWTYVADRWGKTRAMTTALVVVTVLGLLLPWVGGFVPMLVLRLLQGAALGGVAGIAVAFITEETNALHAASATGLYVSGTSIGGLSGRLLSGPVTEATGSWQLGLTSVSVVGALAAAGFVLLVPAPRRFSPVPREGAVRETAHRVVEHLRNPRMLSLFFFAFAMMGSFVTVYNYVSYKLEAPPYLLSETAIALLFLAYLFGTFSSAWAGKLAARQGRLPVMLGAVAVMLGGLALTMVRPLPGVVAGLVLLTLGFFAAHSLASSWTGEKAGAAKAQGTALYNVFYYLGSALVGWAGGLFYQWGGWTPTGIFCAVLVVAGGTVVAVVLGPARSRRAGDVER